MNSIHFRINTSKTSILMHLKTRIFCNCESKLARKNVIDSIRTPPRTHEIYSFKQLRRNKITTNAFKRNNIVQAIKNAHTQGNYLYDTISSTLAHATTPRGELARREKLRYKTRIGCPLKLHALCLWPVPLL